MAESADLARELLGLAGDDEAAARAMLPIGSVTDAIVGFPCAAGRREGAEGCPCVAGGRIPYIHNLSYLAELCETHAIELPTALEGLDDLTPFAAMLRYGSPGQSVERQTALHWATAAVEWARAVIAEAESPQRPSTESDPAL